jgi:cytochrome bd-type quinol oxidase subunit 1
MIKRWARMLCIFFNIGVAGIDLFFGLLLFSSSKSAFAGDTVYLLLAVFPAIAFIASTVFLLSSECGAFFKTFEAAKEDGSTSG